MRRITSILVVLLLVQGLLTLAYRAWEQHRTNDATFEVESIDLRAPPLQMLGLTGPRSLDELGDRTLLVHFWATWCPPCREELPGLIAATRSTAVPLLAITEEPWETVEAYFGGEVPPEIVRDPTGSGARRYGVSGLPDTYVVRQGRIVYRIGAARDWRATGAQRWLTGLAER